MAKKRITVSIEKSLITQVDEITTNRSAFIQALVEGALAGFKTFLVPEGYRLPTFSHAPPPPPSATEEEKRNETDLQRKMRLEAEYAAAGAAGIASRKQSSLTPEQIAFRGTRDGIKNELEEVFARARARLNETASASQEMRSEQLRIFAALKGEIDEEE